MAGKKAKKKSTPKAKPVADNVVRGSARIERDGRERRKKGRRE